MNQEKWSEVDRYFEELFLPPDPALEQALQASDQAGLPAIGVAANQGKLLQILARAMGVRRMLEIGTLGGYSTIWLARALPLDGQLITLESEPRHVEVARANIARAGLADRVEVRLGPALETLPRLMAEGREPFDFIFIDADKANYAQYLAWSLKLSRVGTLIIADNVVRGGGVIDPNSTDPNIPGTRQFNQALAAEKRVLATAFQCVGTKGWDGFGVALVTAAP